MNMATYTDLLNITVESYSDAKKGVGLTLSNEDGSIEMGVYSDKNYVGEVNMPFNHTSDPQNEFDVSVDAPYIDVDIEFTCESVSPEITDAKDDDKIKLTEKQCSIVNELLAEMEFESKYGD